MLDIVQGEAPQDACPFALLRTVRHPRPRNSSATPPRVSTDRLVHLFDCLAFGPGHLRWKMRNLVRLFPFEPRLLVSGGKEVVMGVDQGCGRCGR
jgi:hypothetical protein